MTQQLKEKKVSKKLQKLLDSISNQVAKLDRTVERAYKVGREDGFTDTEIGDMLRVAMKKGGYTPRTIQRHLPNSAKGKQGGASTKTKTDKLSVSERGPKTESVTAAQKRKELNKDLANGEAISVEKVEQLAAAEEMEAARLDDSVIYECDDWPIEDFVMRDARHYTKKYLQKAHSYIGTLIEELRQKEKMT